MKKNLVGLVLFACFLLLGCSLDNDMTTLVELEKAIAERESRVMSFEAHMDSIKRAVPVDITMDKGHAGPMPYSKAFYTCTHTSTSRKSGGKWDDIVLIPYGATTLRISEFPVVTK